MTNLHNLVQHKLLTRKRGYRVDRIECILLQDHEVDQFRFPENHVIFYRYAVVTEDIDLFGNFLTAQHTSLDLVHLVDPGRRDMTRNIFLEFGIFQILGITVDRVHGRITFTVGTLLFQSIETTGHFLRIFRHRLFQVTTGRRYRTDEGHGTRFTIIQMYIAGTCIEVSHDCRQVHRKRVRSGKFFQAVGHLAQSLCPTGSRVGH